MKKAAVLLFIVALAAILFISLTHSKGVKGPDLPTDLEKWPLIVKASCKTDDKTTASLNVYLKYNNHETSTSGQAEIVGSVSVNTNMVLAFHVKTDSLRDNKNGIVYLNNNDGSWAKFVLSDNYEEDQKIRDAIMMVLERKLGKAPEKVFNACLPLDLK